MTTTEQLFTGLTTVVCGIFGSQVSPVLLNTLDTVANVEAPPWAGLLMGPFGALVGLALALWWMKGRLDKAEEKNDKRDAERDEDRKNMITIITQNSIIMSRTSDTLEDAIEVIKEKKQ